MLVSLKTIGPTLAACAGLSLAGLAFTQELGITPPIAPIFSPAPAMSDTQAASTLLAASRAGDASRIRAIRDGSSDPVVRSLALWALADGAPDAMSWTEADAARRQLADWPHASRRQIAAEHLLDRSGLSAQATIAWFGSDPPLTSAGVIALGDALRQAGRVDDAAQMVRKAWRAMPFDAAAQETVLTRLGDLLRPDDHQARADLLIYAGQYGAAQDLLRLLPTDRQAIVQARIASHRGDPGAQALIDALPAGDQNDPGLVYERVVRLRDRGDIPAALALASYLPTSIPDEHAGERLWKHGSLVVQALQAGDALSAYQVAAHSGLSTGSDAASAEFYAGWIALARLKNPRLADEHFAKLEQAGGSPLTQSRALYWRGRAAEAEGDPVAAQIFYGQAAQFFTTFYGQLAAQKGGRTELNLGHDPAITPRIQQAFEDRDVIRATRLLARAGDMDAFRSFVISLSDIAPTAEDEALLVDLARLNGQLSASMRVVRNAAKRGFILPERGYPIRLPPSVGSGAETSLVLGITRQESSFDPAARSGAGARGMMQLMPATAETVARRAGLGWGSLEDADFNMKVGSVYLGQLVNQFSGSYVMATAAYNAGPGRPMQWSSLCGDPRAGSTDPLDFIECIPFSETRDYVMRVLEATQVYRARLNGGEAPLTLAADLKRGGYVPSAGLASTTAPAATMVTAAPVAGLGLNR